MIRQSNLISTFICLTAIFIQGCSQRELCYDHTHGAIVDIEFDWSLEPDAHPSTMVVWAFPTGGGTGTRAEFSGVRRDAVTYQMKVPAGNYTMVCYNGDTDFNRERGNTLTTTVITTDYNSLLSPLNRSDDGAPRPPQSEDQPIHNPADHLYAHIHDTQLNVDEKTGKGHEIVYYTVRFTPQRVSAIWHVRVDIQNFSSDLQASAVVTGVAEHWRISTALPGGNDTTVPFGLTTNDDASLTATFAIFGDVSPHDVKHYLRIYTTSKYYYTYDITDQVHDAPDPKNVYIVVSGLRLPSADGTGMTPGVNDWDDTEVVEIPMK